jgi:hypothetical protein
VTIAKRPSDEAGRQGYAGDLGLIGTGIFLRKGLDTLFGDLPVRQFARLPLHRT